MRKFLDLYRYFSDRRFSTIAGTLVYFLLMSIAPFILWLTLFCGNVNFEKLFSNELFDSIKPVFTALQSSAESAAGGAGIVLLLTSLYSSTNFFYHLRRSGEIVYNSSRIKEGIKLRLVSLLLIFSTIILLAFTTTVIFGSSLILDKIMPYYISKTISIIFTISSAFTVAIVLNIFACPFKLKAVDTVPGSLLTCALWLICLIGFSVYTQFATPEKLYGKLASLIIFLLWIYLMMNSFVIGMIYNGKFKCNRNYKKLF